MRGMEVCYHHGGKSLKGIASPSFEHGRYSRYMPKELAPVFKAVIEDRLEDLAAPAWEDPEAR